MDEQIGRVLKQIEGLGLRERTLVVVTGDHGEAMGEHGEKTHAHFVYEGTMRVPLLFWGATVPKGLTVKSLVRTVDVTPTILDMLNLPPLAGVQGTSLLPLMKGESLDLDLVGYGESIESHIVFGASVLRFVRKGQWKYIHKVKPELFDLAGDPGELKDLSSAHPDIVERLRAELSALIEEAPEQASGARTAIDLETAAQLEALGYMAAAPNKPLGDEMALLEVSGVDPSALIDDMELLAEAEGFRLTQKYEKSATQYRAVIERYPNSVPLLMRTNLVLGWIGEDDERFELLTRVIELAPDTAPAYRQLARIVFERGDPAEAERLLAASLSIDPCTVSPRATLAHLAAQRNDHGRHLQLLKEGIDECPPEDGILNNYAYALATNPDEKHRDGAEALRIAKQITQGEEGRRHDYLDTLACAYAEVGDFASAIRAGEQALALLTAEGDLPLLEESKAHLEQFRAGRPVREP
jgi:tetratricopeptide (TPR) repeat protein